MVASRRIHNYGIINQVPPLSLMVTLQLNCPDVFIALAAITSTAFGWPDVLDAHTGLLLGSYTTRFPSD